MMESIYEESRKQYVCKCVCVNKSHSRSRLVETEEGDCWTTYMVDRECKVEKAPGAMLEILLSYSDSRRTELRPVNVLLSMQLS